MQIGYYQFSPVFGDKKANLTNIGNALIDIEAELIVFPELCTTGYQFVTENEVIELAEGIPEGNTTKRLEEIASATGITIIAGIPEIENNLLYNSAVVISPEGYIGKYRKIHLFYEETIWFQPGEELPGIFEVNGVNVGLLICFDWFFPELFRILTVSGADIIVQPANLILPFCQQAMKTRSIENRIFTLTANRTGYEERGQKERLSFTGLSQVVNPEGEVLVSSDNNSQELRIVNIDIKESRNKDINKYNNLLDARRPDIYAKSKAFN